MASGESRREQRWSSPIHSPLPATIGPFKIERELARGGMGVVCLARDTRPDRQVVTKVMPAHVALDADRLAAGGTARRFLRQSVRERRDTTRLVVF